MIDFAMLREEIQTPLKPSEIRKLKNTTKENNMYCSLQPNFTGYNCVCSCILDGINYYIHEKKQD